MPRNNLLTAAFLFVLALVLLGTLGTTEISVDSYDYATSIREGTQLLHPHHLAYNFVNHQVLNGLTALGFAPEAFRVARAHNLFFAALTLGFTFLFFREMGKTAVGALLGALGLLFCFGFWKMASVVEVYVPGMMFLVAACWYLARLGSGPLRGKDGFILGALLLGAIFYHQTNVLFAVPLAVWLCLRGGRRGGIQAAATLLPSGIVCLAVYVLAAHASGYELSRAGLLDYTFRYEMLDHAAWGTFSNLGPKGWFQLYRSQIANVIVGRYAAVFLYQLLYGLAIIAVIVWNLRQVTRKRIQLPDRHWRIVFLSWLAVHYLFFGWWLPQESEFFVVSLFPLLGLLYFGLRDLWQPNPTGTVVQVIFFVLLVGQIGLHLKYVFFEEHSDQPVRITAQTLDQAVPGSGYLIDERTLVETMRYYHNWTGYGARLLMLKSLGAEPFLEIKDFTKAESILVNLDRISPERDFGGRSGFSHPSEYAVFLRTLFQLRRAEDRGWRARRGTPISIDGQPYLFLGPTDQPHSGPGQLIDDLQAQLPVDRTPGPAFRRWTRKFGSQIAPPLLHP
ncbi:MAG: hypothetical protein AAF998_07575 [Bacteroidota bacterium]